MLRLPVGAGLSLFALGLMAASAHPAAAAQRELPAGVTITVTPLQLTPDTALTASGPKFPGECASGRVQLRKIGATEPEYQLGSELFMDTASWTVSAAKVKDLALGLMVDLPLGQFNVGIMCTYGTPPTSDTYNVPIVVTVVAPPTTTTTIPATTTSTLPASTTTTTTVSSSTTTTAAPVDVTKGTVEPTSAKPASTQLTLRGGGFGPNQQLKIALNSTPLVLGTTGSNGDGLYATTLTLPANAAPGDHTVTVTGTDRAGQARTTSAALTVQDLGCADFTTQAAAQLAMGPDGADPHGLDPDKDGQACATGGVAKVSAGRVASSTSGNLPRTGTGFGSVAGALALCALAFGALFMGLSHPEVAAVASHRRMGLWRRFRSSEAAPAAPVASDPEA